MAKIDAARRQLKTLEALAGRYVWVVLLDDGTSVLLVAYGPQGVRRLRYNHYVVYFREVYGATEEITRQEYGRVPTIEEMILVWRDEIQRLEALAKEERRRGKKRYILRSDGPGMPGLGR